MNSSAFRDLWVRVMFWKFSASAISENFQNIASDHKSRNVHEKAHTFFFIYDTLNKITPSLCFHRNFRIALYNLFLHSMERFHSRDQQPHWITETKESIRLKIEFNSRKISLVRHHGCHFFVLEH